MFKSWFEKMEWNDKAAIAGTLVFVIVCECERLYLNRKAHNQKQSDENATESDKKT